MKLTKVKLSVFTDINMLLMVEKGMRGGISIITKRYAKANNPYMKKYDPKEVTSYLSYIDCNSLYGWAMTQYLPTGNYKWNKEEWTTEKILSIPDESTTGYMFEVDLEYPHELHNLHNCYPLAPETTSPIESKYMKDVKEKLNLNTAKVEKLIPNLNDKNNYVVHYRNLKLYLQLGLKQKKVHRALSFDQSEWLKQYIMLNTTLKQKAITKFEKDFLNL